MVQRELRDETPNGSMLHRGAERGGRLYQAVQPAEWPAFGQLKAGLVASERQTIRQVAIQARRLGMDRPSCWDGCSEVQIHQRQENFSANVAGFLTAGDRPA